MKLTLEKRHAVNALLEEMSGADLEPYAAELIMLRAKLAAKNDLIRAAEETAEVRRKLPAFRPEGEWLPQSPYELTLRNILRDVRDGHTEIPEAVWKIRDEC